MRTSQPTRRNPISNELSNVKSRERLVHVAVSILRDGTEAEDAAHDAVVQALRGSESFRADSLVSTWLHRVVVNAALMRARRRRRASERAAANDQSGQGERADVISLLADPHPTPETQLQDQDERLRLHAAVAELPQPYREVVQLCVFEELALSDRPIRVQIHKGTDCEQDMANQGAYPAATMSACTASSASSGGYPATIAPS
jgi:RNA polymerase sigma-70 factor, ECF subfamily